MKIFYSFIYYISCFLVGLIPILVIMMLFMDYSIFDKILHTISGVVGTIGFIDLANTLREKLFLLKIEMERNDEY